MYKRQSQRLPREADEAGEKGPRPLSDTRGMRAWMTVSSDAVVWVAVAAMAVIVLPRKVDRRAPRQVGLAFGLLAMFELTFSAQRLLVVTPLEQVGAARPLTDLLRGSRREGSGPVRVAASPRALTDLDAVMAGVEKTNINDSFQIQHAANLYERLYPFLDDAPRRACLLYTSPSPRD